MSKPLFFFLFAGKGPSGELSDKLERLGEPPAQLSLPRHCPSAADAKLAPDLGRARLPGGGASGPLVDAGAANVDDQGTSNRGCGEAISIRFSIEMHILLFLLGHSTEHIFNRTHLHVGFDWIRCVPH